MTDNFGHDDDPLEGPDEELPPPLSDDERAEKNQVMAADLHALTVIGIFMSLAAVALALGLWGLGVRGARDFAFGLSVGCTVSVVNMRVLGGLAYALFDGFVQRALASLMFSLVCLIGSAYWIVGYHPKWGLGYGVGLALPAAAGVYWAFQTTRRPWRS